MIISRAGTNHVTIITHPCAWVTSDRRGSFRPRPSLAICGRKCALANNDEGPEPAETCVAGRTGHSARLTMPYPRLFYPPWFGYGHNPTIYAAGDTTTISREESGARYHERFHRGSTGQTRAQASI